MSFSTCPGIYHYRVQNTWDCLNMLLLFNLLYVIIDLTMVSSMGNGTLTCLMCDSSHDDHNKMIILEWILYEYYIKVQSINLFKRQSNTPFQSYKDFVIFVHSSDLCCGSYEQVSTHSLWNLCRLFLSIHLCT